MARRGQSFSHFILSDELSVVNQSYPAANVG
jgi:hypothetical protein